VVSDINMHDILSEMAAGLTGIQLIAIVDIDCMMLASWESPDNKLSPEGLGWFIQRINGTINAFKQSAPGSTRLNDVILNAPSGYVLLKPICNGTCFIVVATPRSVSLGSIRTACNNYTPRLEQAMPGYEPSPLSDGRKAIVPQS
jgi:predicted regulator of Ras-like GTPase activity (Roadblock/LC7/MglB family)